MRILSISDLHCGNIAGITPDEFNPNSEVGHKMHLYRKTLYHWVQGEIERLKPIDLCVVNGDAIDGKGEKSGGNEQITTDRTVQIDMAIDFCKWIDAEKYLFTYGTGYHVGQEEDWENRIAKEFNTLPEATAVYNANGLLMKWRHHTGNASAYAARSGSLMRNQVNDILWSVGGEEERGDVLIYSHVHYFLAVFDRFGAVFASPALQGWGGSQLGARKMGGIVDYGFLHFDVFSKDNWTWKNHKLLQTSKLRQGLLAGQSQQPVSL
ncbi:MAG: hypothetical protein V1775_02240 [Bacteroidota bacterium]